MSQPIYCDCQTMIAKAFAVILALVMANPLCCCAFAATLEAGEPPIHSCCSGNNSDSGGEGQPDEREKRGCGCHLDRDKTTTEVALPGPPDEVRSPGFPAPAPAPFPGPPAPLPLAVPLASKWPPGHLRPPSLRRRLACHGSYRL